VLGYFEDIRFFAVHVTQIHLMIASNVAILVFYKVQMY